ncbi:CHAP domain-containing protein [Brassicibacter mesophilus]|uniref:CHAP domain-containing protein n=1 Tax=Brassicibacter mesophilus TaxID=745119 RepID=UPI003D1C76E3
MTKREKLANIAKEEAQKCLHGNVMTVKSNIQPIANLFPKWALENWDGKWCAAFVYYCCIKAGFNIPVKYPNEKVTFSFAGCGAWEEWAKLHENHFYYSREDKHFLPEKGDIVLYDKVFCDKPHDHIGIIIENTNNSIIVAEGNINNVSGIIEREKNNHIRGYIRIPNDYVFNIKQS